MTLREELIQVAAVAVAIVEDLDHGVADMGGSGANREWYIAQAEPILEEIRKERLRQDAKWGPQHYELTMWLTILMEEVGEAAQAYLDEWTSNG